MQHECPYTCSRARLDKKHAIVIQICSLRRFVSRNVTQTSTSSFHAHYLHTWRHLRLMLTAPSLSPNPSSFLLRMIETVHRHIVTEHLTQLTTIQRWQARTRWVVPGWGWLLASRACLLSRGTTMLYYREDLCCCWMLYSSRAIATSTRMRTWALLLIALTTIYQLYDISLAEMY